MSDNKDFRTVVAPLGFSGVAEKPGGGYAGSWVCKFCGALSAIEADTEDVANKRTYRSLVDHVEEAHYTPSVRAIEKALMEHGSMNADKISDVAGADLEEVSNLLELSRRHNKPFLFDSRTKEFSIPEPE